MSVIVVLKVPGDTDKFRAALSSRADEFAKIGAGARADGAIHHRFGIGDGVVLVVDEWESAEKFQAFFSDPSLQAFIGEVGGQGEPEVTFAEAVASADEF
jgi:heme-degrading monooxygenase HmoA